MIRRTKSYVSGPPRLAGHDYSDSDTTYAVTLCVADRRPIFSDPVFAQPVIGCLHWLRANRGITLYAFVLMPDHAHLLIRPGRSLGEIIKSFKRHTTREVNALGGPEKLWQDNYYDHAIRRLEDAEGIAVYFLANPVRKGLVASSEEYAFSGMPDPM